MAGEASKAIDTKTLWGGGRSPASMSYGKMMMWMFLVSDALTFGGLLIGLGFFKWKFSEIWPNSEEVFTHLPFLHGFHAPLIYVALMTFILIVSSVTMVMAVEAGHRNDHASVKKWMLWTVLGGVVFLGSQAWEWYTFISGPDGEWGTFDDTGLMFNMFRNIGTTADGGVLWGEGPSAYGMFFFCVTGFHGFHVFSGVLINLIIYINTLKGVYERRGHYEMIEKVGLYWHFIDLVWVFVFTFFYLI
jgi:cytochrome c oxidase subunit 3